MGYTGHWYWNYGLNWTQEYKYIYILYDISFYMMYTFGVIMHYTGQKYSGQHTRFASLKNTFLGRFFFYLIWQMTFVLVA